MPVEWCKIDAAAGGPWVPVNTKCFGDLAEDRRAQSAVKGHFGDSYGLVGGGGIANGSTKSVGFGGVAGVVEGEVEDGAN